MTYVGSPIRRREDERLITGQGQYADDVPVAGALHAAFVRSPHAHARIVKIDASKALALPGVSAVITGKDIPAGGSDPRALGVPLPPEHPDFHVARWRALAIDKVLYVGEPLAVVLAGESYTARDAAELVEVEYEPLPAASDPAGALDPGAAILHEHLGSNLAFKYSMGSPDIDDALKQADETVTVNIKQSRLVCMAMEPRATVAQYDGYTGGVTVWTATQAPHFQMHALAGLLGIPENQIRVITRDMGGGFGLKAVLYGDEVTIVYLAWQRKCAIRWAETRSESFQAMAQGRGLHSDVTLGINRDGTLVAMRVDILTDVGAYIPPNGAIPALMASVLAAGVYRTPKVVANVTGVYTNRPPTSPYRGAGRPEAIYSLERAVDLAARKIGMDPAEVRRRNYIGPEQFPYTTPTNSTYDVGEYRAALDKALQAVEYDKMREDQARLRTEGRYIGIGISSFVDSSAAMGWESGTVRVDRSGKVTLLTGSSAHGQGHATTFSQIVADVLTVPIDDVQVIHGDTAVVPVGVGTFGSRSAALGGSSALRAAERMNNMMRQIAANRLEAGADDVELADGKFFVAGTPDKAIPFAGVAGASYFGQGLGSDLSPGLEETEVFNEPRMAYPFGTHVAVVEVKPDTGEVEFLRYVSVDDCGNLINPLLVDGQVVGGVAQGLGQALYEGVIYDENGQLASGTLMDYAIPRASHM
ncbi:MAG: xanthine dehydrogenase family protein molybdopterin-binding subunit, partial [Chloroflexota bacterium]